MRVYRKILALLLAAALLLPLAACGDKGNAAEPDPAPETPDAVIPAPDEAADEDGTGKENSDPAPEEQKNGDVVILFTSDVHCGIDQGFGYAGLQRIRDTLESRGYTTILVDDGDAVQGDAIGTLSRGEAIIELMNAARYDLAIPGNHEFDYGMEQFLKLADMAQFPYISCNFNREGELIFAPYVIKEAAGMRIAFVGVTTPQTLSSSTPRYFQNDDGEFIYGFLQDDSGQAVYDAVQRAVDSARAEGADYVYVVGHMGLGEVFSPWSYADLIEHTSGIDVFLDGHSHDTEQVVMKNKDGENVARSACGTRLKCIGYSYITAEGGIGDTGVWSWPNDVGAPELLGIDNEMNDLVLAAREKLEAQLEVAVAESGVDLTIYDPNVTDASGHHIRMVRRAETNLGDLCADAILTASGADVALVNGGGIRADIGKGDVTYGDIITVFPFGNELCVVEATGQQILDALEWSANAVPGEFGGFLQVAGMSYEIDVSIPSGCVVDSENMLVGIEGERRVKNVMIGGEPLDPEKTYTVASTDYVLLSSGDGHTAFSGAALLQDRVKLDNQLLIDYIVNTLGGTVGSEYADPYGQGRIVITGGE